MLPPKRRSWSRASLRVAAIAALAALMLVFAAPSFAQASADGTSIPYWADQQGLLSCTGNYYDIVQGTTSGLKKCESFCDLLTTAQRIVNFAITVVLFIGVPVMLVYGGVMLLTSATAEERRSTGKKAIVSALIGAAIMLGAYLILNTFLWLVGNGTSVTGYGAGEIHIAWPRIQCQIAPATTP
jgi:hypothetical protein